MENNTTSRRRYHSDTDNQNNAAAAQAPNSPPVVIHQRRPTVEIMHPSDMRKPLIWLILASLSPFLSLVTALYREQYYNPWTYICLISLVAINAFGLEFLGIAPLFREVMANLRSWWSGTGWGFSWGWARLDSQTRTESCAHDKSNAAQIYRELVIQNPYLREMM